MGFDKNISEIRILLCSLAFALGILSYTFYIVYADDIKQRDSKKISEYSQEMDNHLARI